MKILFVEDDYRNVEPLVSVLTGRGHEVAYARDSERAFAHTAVIDFDVVICDYDLGYDAGHCLKGPEIITRMRRGALPDARYAIWSGLDRPDTPEWAAPISKIDYEGLMAFISGGQDGESVDD